MKLVLFFTYHVSLKQWRELGLFDREMSLYRRLAQNGVSVSMITYGDASDVCEELEREGIRILPLYTRCRRIVWGPARFLQSFLIPFYFRRELKEADILKTNQIWGGWAAALASIFFKKPLIVRCGFEPNLSFRLAGRGRMMRLMAWLASLFAYGSAKRICVAAKPDKEEIQRLFPWINPDGIEVRMNYVDSSMFKPDGNPKSFDVLFAGRLSPEKGPDRLLKALSGANISLVFAGAGPLETELKKLSGEGSPAVIFKGAVPNDKMPELMNSCRIFVICSSYEGNPKSLIEAMSCGAAVVGTDVAGVRDLIKDEVNGILCKEDASSIRAAVERLVASPDLRESLGREARRTVVEEASLDCYAAKELSLYKNLLGDKEA